MAEIRKAFKLSEIVPRTDNLLLIFERLAILMAILTKYKRPSLNEFGRTTLFCLELFQYRRPGLNASTLKYYGYLFWVERAWSASLLILIVPYSFKNYYWFIAVGSFLCCTICSARSLKQKSHNNSIPNPNPNPNPRETNKNGEEWSERKKKWRSIGDEVKKLDFWMKRLLSFIFILYPSNAELLASIFRSCLSTSLILHLFGSPFGIHLHDLPTHDYLFWIERAAKIVLDLHCAYKIPFTRSTATYLFTFTNTRYFCRHLFFVPKEKHKSSSGLKISTNQLPISIPNSKLSESSNGEQFEKEKAKIEDDHGAKHEPKEGNKKLEEDMVEANYERSKEEESLKEEESKKWEEDLLEDIDDHLKQESQVYHEKSQKEEKDKWVGWLFPDELGRFCCLEQSPQPHVNLSWEEEEPDEDDSSGVENDMRVATAEEVIGEILEVESLKAESDNWKLEKEVVDHDDGNAIEEQERLKAENDNLKRENKLLEEKLTSERHTYEDSRSVWELRNQELNAKCLEANQEVAALVGELEKHRTMLAKMDAYGEDRQKCEQEMKTEIAAKIEALTAALDKWEQEKVDLTQQISAANSLSQNLWEKLDAATNTKLDDSRACLCCLKFVEKSNELARKLEEETSLARGYYSLVYELEEKCRRLEAEGKDLAAKLCAATASSQLYKTMLHDAGC